MARVFDLKESGDEIVKSLSRAFQSGYINFLIGSGASLPAIPIAGNVEREIANLFDGGKEDEGRLKMYEFLASILEPTNKLIGAVDDDNNTKTLDPYRACLGIIETILSEGRPNILPRQATIFTTNYDLFIEAASANYAALKLNDGFIRLPRLDGRAEYSSRTFFNSTFSTGNLYDYKVEIPTINLIKLHGSLSWRKDGDDFLFSVKKRDLLPESYRNIRQYWKWKIQYSCIPLPGTREGA